MPKDFARIYNQEDLLLTLRDVPIGFWELAMDFLVETLLMLYFLVIKNAILEFGALGVLECMHQQVDVYALLAMFNTLDFMEKLLLVILLLLLLLLPFPYRRVVYWHIRHTYLLITLLPIVALDFMFGVVLAVTEGLQHLSIAVVANMLKLRPLREFPWALILLVA